MASSGYTAITFVANEQPTTAKWNLIGSNDASFNNGNGFEDGILVTRHYADSSITGAKIASYRTKRKNNGSAIAETAARIETGWEVVQPGATSQGSKAVTFQTAFTNVPIIFTDMGGDQTSGTQALGNGSNTIQGRVVTKHVDDTVNGFTLRFYADAAWAAGNNVYLTWIAIGT